MTEIELIIRTGIGIRPFNFSIHRPVLIHALSPKNLKMHSVLCFNTSKSNTSSITIVNRGKFNIEQLTARKPLLVLWELHGRVFRKGHLLLTHLYW